jgi:hypothetical protein
MEGVVRFIHRSLRPWTKNRGTRRRVSHTANVDGTGTYKLRPSSPQRVFRYNEMRGTWVTVQSTEFIEIMKFEEQTSKRYCAYRTEHVHSYCNLISVERRGNEGYLYIFCSVITRNGIFQTRQLRSVTSLFQKPCKK